MNQNRSVRKRNLSDELRELKRRLSPGSEHVRGWPLDERIAELRRVLELVPSNAAELLKYFPLAAVATLESYFRGVVAAVIDNSDEFRERGLQLVGDRSLRASEAIQIVHSEIATPGQLVAHLLPCSSVRHLEEPLGVILGFDIKSRIKDAFPHFANRLGMEGAQPIVDDVSELWSRLVRLFELRHILAHEAPDNFEVTFDQAEDSVDTVDRYMQSMDAVLWGSVWKDVPVTHREMTDNAWREMCDARKKLANLLRKLRCCGRLNVRLHLIWKRYFVSYTRGLAEGQMGSIRNLVYFSVAADMIQDRIKQLEPSLEDGYIG